MSQNVHALAVLILLCAPVLVWSEELRPGNDPHSGYRYQDSGTETMGTASTISPASNLIPMHSIRNRQNWYHTAPQAFRNMQSNYVEPSYIPTYIMRTPHTSTMRGILPHGGSTHETDGSSQPIINATSLRGGLSNQIIPSPTSAGQSELLNPERRDPSNRVPIYVIRPPRPGIRSPSIVNVAVLSPDQLNPEIIRILQSLGLPQDRVPLVLVAGPIPSHSGGEPDDLESGIPAMSRRFPGSLYRPMANMIPPNTLSKEEWNDDEVMKDETLLYRKRPSHVPHLGRFLHEPAPALGVPDPNNHRTTIPVESDGFVVPRGRYPPIRFLPTQPNFLPSAKAPERLYQPTYEVPMGFPDPGRKEYPFTRIRHPEYPHYGTEEDLNSRPKYLPYPSTDDLELQASPHSRLKNPPYTNTFSNQAPYHFPTRPYPYFPLIPNIQNQPEAISELGRVPIPENALQYPSSLHENFTGVPNTMRKPFHPDQTARYPATIQIQPNQASEPSYPSFTSEDEPQQLLQEQFSHVPQSDTLADVPGLQPYQSYQDQATLYTGSRAPFLQPHSPFPLLHSIPDGTSNTILRPNVPANIEEILHPEPVSNPDVKFQSYTPSPYPEGIFSRQEELSSQIHKENPQLPFSDRPSSMNNTLPSEQQPELAPDRDFAGQSKERIPPTDVEEPTMNNESEVSPNWKILGLPETPHLRPQQRYSQYPSPLRSGSVDKEPQSWPRPDMVSTISKLSTTEQPIPTTNPQQQHPNYSPEYYDEPQNYPRVSPLEPYKHPDAFPRDHFRDYTRELPNGPIIANIDKYKKPEQLYQQPVPQYLRHPSSFPEGGPTSHLHGGSQPSDQHRLQDSPFFVGDPRYPKNLMSDRELPVREPAAAAAAADSNLERMHVPEVPNLMPQHKYSQSPSPPDEFTIHSDREPFPSRRYPNFPSQIQDLRAQGKPSYGTETTLGPVPDVSPKINELNIPEQAYQIPPPKFKQLPSTDIGGSTNHHGIPEASVKLGDDPSARTLRPPPVIIAKIKKLTLPQEPEIMPDRKYSIYTSTDDDAHMFHPHEEPMTYHSNDQPWLPAQRYVPIRTDSNQPTPKTGSDEQFPRYPSIVNGGGTGFTTQYHDQQPQFPTTVPTGSSYAYIENGPIIGSREIVQSQVGKLYVPVQGSPQNPSSVLGQPSESYPQPYLPLGGSSSYYPSDGDEPSLRPHLPSQPGSVIDPELTVRPLGYPQSQRYPSGQETETPSTRTVQNNQNQRYPNFPPADSVEPFRQLRPNFRAGIEKILIPEKTPFEVEKLSPAYSPDTIPLKQREGIHPYGLPDGATSDQPNQMSPQYNKLPYKPFQVILKKGQEPQDHESPSRSKNTVDLIATQPEYDEIPLHPHQFRQHFSAPTGQPQQDFLQRPSFDNQLIPEGPNIPSYDGVFNIPKEAPDLSGVYSPWYPQSGDENPSLFKPDFTFQRESLRIPEGQKLFKEVYPQHPSVDYSQPQQYPSAFPELSSAHEPSTERIEKISEVPSKRPIIYLPSTEQLQIPESSISDRSSFPLGPETPGRFEPERLIYPKSHTSDIVANVERFEVSKNENLPQIGEQPTPRLDLRPSNNVDVIFEKLRVPGQAPWQPGAGYPQYPPVGLPDPREYPDSLPQDLGQRPQTQVFPDHSFPLGRDGVDSPPDGYPSFIPSKPFQQSPDSLFPQDPSGRKYNEYLPKVVYAPSSVSQPRMIAESLHLPDQHHSPHLPEYPQYTSTDDISKYPPGMQVAYGDNTSPFPRHSLIEEQFPLRQLQPDGQMKVGRFDFTEPPSLLPDVTQLKSPSYTIPETHRNPEHPGSSSEPFKRTSGTPTSMRGKDNPVGSNLPESPTLPGTGRHISLPVANEPQSVGQVEYRDSTPLPVGKESSYLKTPTVFVYPVTRQPESTIESLGPQLVRHPSGPPQSEPHKYLPGSLDPAMYPVVKSPGLQQFDTPSTPKQQSGFPQFVSRSLQQQEQPHETTTYLSGTTGSLRPDVEISSTPADLERHTTLGYQESLSSQPNAPLPSLDVSMPYPPSPAEQISSTSTLSDLDVRKIHPSATTGQYAIPLEPNKAEPSSQVFEDAPQKSIAQPPSDRGVPPDFPRPHSVSDTEHPVSQALNLEEPQQTEESEKSSKPKHADASLVNILNFPTSTEGEHEYVEGGRSTLQPADEGKELRPVESSTRISDSSVTVPSDRMTIIQSTSPQAMPSEKQFLAEPSNGMTDSPLDPDAPGTFPTISDSSQTPPSPSLLPDSKITRIFPDTKPTFYTDKDGQNFVSLKLLNEPISTSPTGDVIPREPTDPSQQPKTTDLVIPIGQDISDLSVSSSPHNTTQPHPMLKGIPISNVQVFDSQTLVKVIESCNCSNLKFLIPILKRPQSAIVVANNENPDVAD